MNLEREINIIKYLLEQVDVIRLYVEGLDEDAFLRDIKTKDAVLTRLMVIGEYSAKIDDEIKERFTTIDWKLIKSARNYYAHVYRGIDWILVWNVVVDEIPKLRSGIENIIESLEKGN